MKHSKLLSSATLLTLSGLLLTGCKSMDIQVKNEEIGLFMTHYFDSFARQPEVKDKLNEAKDLLLVAFESADTNGKCYGLGSIGGANTDKYKLEVGGGIFDAIARQPEMSDNLLFFEKASIDKILKTTIDSHAEMIGFGTASLCDALGRSPQIADHLKTSFEYITDSILKVNEEDAYSIGYASKGYYDAVARQTEVATDLWTSFKAYIDTLIPESK